MKDRKNKQQNGINRRSLRWIFASKKKRIKMLLHARDPEKMEAFFQRLMNESAEQSESERLEQERALDAFIERREKELAELGEEERMQLEQKKEALWRRIQKALEEGKNKE